MVAKILTYDFRENYSGSSQDRGKIAKLCYPGMWQLLHQSWSSLIWSNHQDLDILHQLNFSLWQWQCFCLLGSDIDGTGFCLAFSLFIGAVSKFSLFFGGSLPLPELPDPVRPFGLCSSASTRKVSKFSWKAFASPKYRMLMMANKSSNFKPLM